MNYKAMLIALIGIVYVTACCDESPPPADGGGEQGGTIHVDGGNAGSGGAGVTPHIHTCNDGWYVCQYCTEPGAACMVSNADGSDSRFGECGADMRCSEPCPSKICCDGLGYCGKP
jgi:hypothetical protein